MKTVSYQRPQQTTLPYHNSNPQMTSSSSSSGLKQESTGKMSFFPHSEAINPPAYNPNYKPELSDIMQFPKRIEEEKTELNQLRQNITGQQKNLERLKSNGRMAINISRKADFKSDTFVTQKGYSQAVLKEIDEKLRNLQSIESKIVQIESQLNGLSKDVEDFAQPIYEKISTINTSAESTNGMAQEQAITYGQFQSRLEKLAFQRETQRKEFDSLNQDPDYDQYRSNLMDQNVSLLLSTESMSKGKYTYALKIELKQNQVIEAFSEFSLQIKSDADYVRNHQRLIQLIVKIQTAVNKSEPSHLITTKYLAELVKMDILKSAEDAESFIDRVIVASMHRNPLSRYTNRKTATISNMILKFNGLLQEKTIDLRMRLGKKLGENLFNMQFYFANDFDFSKSDFKSRISELCKMLRIAQAKPSAVTEQALKDIGCFKPGSGKRVLEQIRELQMFSNIPGVFDPIEQLISDLDKKIRIASYEGQQYWYLGSVRPGATHTVDRVEESDEPWGLGGKYVVREIYSNPDTASDGYLYGDDGQIFLQIEHGRKKGDYFGEKISLR